MISARQVAQTLSKRTLPALERERLQTIPFHDAGHGYDVFGLEPNHVAIGLSVTWPLYRWYFRVSSEGAQNVPRTGAAILAANHSGMLPIDGMMLWTDVLLRVGRVPRIIEDFFVQGMPLVGTLFARAGVVAGSKGNLRALLKSGELAAIFPEGVPGIAKPFTQAYHLQAWRPGHAELAIRHGVPVIPVAIIGAEEQWTQIAKLPRLGHIFGVPHIPIPLTPLPLPVAYHLRYGEPLLLHSGSTPADADDPAFVQSAAIRVRNAVDALISQGLQQRKGVFS
jgi:1-acyl-sn-glycerol-3-phosphate acyltransferase